MTWSLTKDKNWESLEKEFRWVADMNGVEQDSNHHAEGDVAVHTRMVLQSLCSLEQFHKLDTPTQELLWASALLHDVEKRSTTIIETDGSITSRGHAKKGERTTRTILFKDIPTSFFIREKVCALVRYHGLPLWIFDKIRPVKALFEAALRIETPLLAMLAKADVLGRICNDQQELLDRLDLFEAFCQEQQCWTASPEFGSNLARFVYFQKEDSSPDYNPYDDLKSEVTILCGLPGMGKDKHIERFYGDLPVVSLDEIRRKHKLKPDDASATGWVVQTAKEQARIYLRKAEPFVLNATNITRQTRSQWIDLCASYKARVKLVYIEVPYIDWIKQNTNREHPVPTNVLERMLSKLEVPALFEAHDVMYEVL